MNVKEKFIEMLQRDGYDTISACELASARVAELNSKPHGIYRLYSRSDSIAVRVGPRDPTCVFCNSGEAHEH